MALETVSQPKRQSSSDTTTEVPGEEDSELNLDDNANVAQQPARIRIISHGTDDWGPADVAFLNVPAQGVPKSFSSVVRDAGYSFESSESIPEDSPEQDHVLKGLGTQFDSEHSGSSHTPEASTTQTYFLETWLRSKRVSSAERKDLPFLPVDQLEQIMTFENIFGELYRAGLREKLADIANSLCQKRKKSRQRIFAILCMLQLPAEITVFIQADIFDKDLPFTFKNDVVYREMTTGATRFEIPVFFFQNPPWQPHIRESFDRYQGQLLAPRFKLSWTKADKVLHFPLKDQLVLPFMKIENESEDGELESLLRHYGGTSTVRKVKIHPAHHNACPTPSAQSRGYFAVKELQVTKTANQPDTGIDDEEARALKRFNTRCYPHLIRLLATYTYEGRFHLIFPWADGNLKDLWMLPEFITETNRDIRTVKWMATQILGLARALQIIHYCPIDEDNVEDLPAKDKQRLYGRHGDLKPENILWFRHDEDAHGEGTAGILKIADFGFADFHSKHSRSNVRKSAVGGFTDTYKAPEYDVNQRVSPQYDIWSFGCILLQFVVWYLRGWKGVDDFSKERTADSRGAPMAADIFFGLEASVGNSYKARAKPSVIETFRDLKEEEACSDYVLDLLQYIQKNLLRLTRTKRAKIEDIVMKFEQLHDQCQKDPEYCTVRTKSASRTNSGLSEIQEEMVEVPNSPGKGVVAGSAPPVRSGTFSPTNIRRSMSNGSQRDIRSSSRPSSRRQGSLSSIPNREPVRPRSKLAQHSPMEVDIAEPLPKNAKQVLPAHYPHPTSSNLARVSTSDSPSAIYEDRLSVTSDAIMEVGASQSTASLKEGAKDLSLELLKDHTGHDKISFRAPHREADASGGQSRPVLSMSDLDRVANGTFHSWSSDIQQTKVGHGKIQPVAPPIPEVQHTDPPAPTNRRSRFTQQLENLARRGRHDKACLRRRIDKVLDRLLGSGNT